MEPTLHIDGDILPYKVGFATQRTVYMLDVEGAHSCSPLLITRSKIKVNKWLKECPDLLVTEFFYVESAIQAINTLKLNIQGIVAGAGAKRFKVVVSGDTNFREEIATIQPYKGNRTGMEKPRHWEMLRNWLLEMPYTIVAENEEADDVLSKACMQGHPIATIDKDLNNTPGWHYNFNKNEKYYVTEDEARFNFYAQCLTGDTADHIPGIKGIGPKKAEKLLAGLDDEAAMEAAVLAAYKRSGIEDAVGRLTEVGQLLWMRRVDNEMYYPIVEGGTRVL